MPHRRLHRAATTFFMVLSLLFSQLALAQYVCPKEADQPAMAEKMAAGEPCSGMDEDQPALCHQHSAASAKSFEAAKLPVAGHPVAVQFLELPALPEAQAERAVHATATPEAQAPPDPLFLSTLRLRV
jgi:hypothetical protein